MGRLRPAASILNAGPSRSSNWPLFSANQNTTPMRNTSTTLKGISK